MNKKKFTYLILALLLILYPFFDVIVDFSEPPKTCIQHAELGDCGGISHVAIALMFFCSILFCGLVVENRNVRRSAQAVAKLLAFIFILHQCFRYAWRVKPQPHKAVIKGAYVLNMPKCVLKWQRMQNMLASFPPGVVQRAQSRRWIGRFGFSVREKREGGRKR
jgi:hypothetical protein